MIEKKFGGSKVDNTALETDQTSVMATALVSAAPHIRFSGEEDSKRSNHFRFMDLPPELRTRIYDFALVWSSSTTPPNIVDRAWIPHGRRQLLGVSRLVRKEALPVYYSENYFSTDHVESQLHNWLGAIGTDAVKELSHLVVIGAGNCVNYLSFRMELVESNAAEKEDRPELVVSGVERDIPVTMDPNRWGWHTCGHFEHTNMLANDPNKWARRAKRLRERLRECGKEEVVVRFWEGLH